MKCNKCKTLIPPSFVAAITDNKCPACGGAMMADATYQRIYQVQQQIEDLGFPEENLIGIAAALATRFTLVPRDLATIDTDEDVDSAPAPIRPTAAAKRNKAPASKQDLIEYYSRYEEQPVDLHAEDRVPPHLPDEDVSEEEAARIEAEWGLQEGNAAMVTLADPVEISSDALTEIVSEVSSFDAQEVESVPQVVNKPVSADGRRRNLLERAKRNKEINGPAFYRQGT